MSRSAEEGKDWRVYPNLVEAMRGGGSAGGVRNIRLGTQHSCQPKHVDFLIFVRGPVNPVFE